MSEEYRLTAREAVGPWVGDGHRQGPDTRVAGSPVAEDVRRTSVMNGTEELARVVLRAASRAQAKGSAVLKLC